MRRLSLCWTIVFVLTVVMGLRGTWVEAQDNQCQTAHQNLQNHYQQLADYAASLKAFADARDVPVVEILNHKIADLLEEIKRTKELLSHCPREQPPQPPGRALSPPKTDQDLYGGKSCEELRTLLFHHLRQVNMLKRREESVFSRLSPTEQTELQESLQALKDIRSVLHKKCGDPLPPSQSPKRQAPNTAFPRRTN